MNFFWIILLAIVIVIPFVFFVIYYFFSRKEKYNYINILKRIEKSAGCEIDQASKDMLMASIYRVNGWNSMVTIHSSLYYSFNFWSISFSLLSIGFDCSKIAVLPLICSVCSIIFLTTNLFFRFEHKWIVFKNKWTKAALITNEFIKSTTNNSQPTDLIANYYNKIIEIEKSIKQDDVI